MHAAIETEKAVEPRRAAVAVIRQILVGLGSEMTRYLTDDMLMIYRTLKVIYNDDADDVMRLQAQLALEVLNENMRDSLFPSSSLYQQDKKPINLS